MTVSLSMLLCFPHHKRACKAAFRITPEYDVSMEEMQSWGDKFTSLISHREGRKLFKEYLKTEYSDENILFYEAVMDFEQEENDDEMFEKAKLIYENFISTMAQREVSLDSRIRDKIQIDMINPDRTVFDAAKHHIYDLMKRDSYPRFKASSLYANALKNLRVYLDSNVFTEE